MDNTQIAARFFDALANDDGDALRSLCAPDFRPQQNGGPVLSIEDLLGFAKATHHVVKSFEYGDPIRVATATGFVQEHHIRGTLPNGEPVNIPVCVVGDVQGGRLTAAREYFDTAAAADVLEAMKV